MDLGNRSLQRGPGAEPRWGSRGARDMLISSYDEGHAPMSPLSTPLYKKLTRRGDFYSTSTSFLPARRYASAGLRDSDVSVCLSVRHTPVLCLAERKQDREMYTV